jgi:acetyl-CoA carboxylase biotin carboxyl carrier protein
MNIDDIRKLLAQLTTLMNDNKLAELEIEQDGLRIHLKKHSDQPSVAPTGAAALTPPEAVAGGQGSASPSQTGLITIASPMVGTLYRTPSPESDPFVEIGDTVDHETVVCIIEAMKVFNEIKAECEGKVVDILIGNGEAVEFGQALFLVEPAR